MIMDIIEWAAIIYLFIELKKLKDMTLTQGPTKL